MRPLDGFVRDLRREDANRFRRSAAILRTKLASLPADDTSERLRTVALIEAAEAEAVRLERLAVDGR